MCAKRSVVFEKFEKEASGRKKTKKVGEYDTQGSRVITDLSTN